MNIPNLENQWGFINLFKAPGMSSFDCVRRLRKILNIKKIGHMGTLDPPASGVLPVAVGRATRLIEYASGGTKVYKTVIRLGVRTNTDDMAGDIIEKIEITPPDIISIKEFISENIGEISQIPPAISAVHVDGRRAYQIARGGGSPEIDARTVRIYSMDILDYSFPLVTMVVRCGPGTYIRSIARDLGEKLGCGGAVESLVRTASGKFCAEKSLTLEDIEEMTRRGDADGIFIEPSMMMDLPCLELGPEECREVAVGNSVSLSNFSRYGGKFDDVKIDGAEEFKIILKTPSGRILAIGKHLGDFIKPEKVFLQIFEVE